MNVMEVSDREQWNRIVLSFPKYHLHQGYEWGEIRRDGGWTPYRYAVMDGVRAIAAVSIAAHRLKGTPFSLLYASRGPLMEWTNPLAWEGLRDAIREVADRTRAIFLRISPAVSDTDSTVREALVANGFRHLSNDWTWWNSPRVVALMPIDGPDVNVRRKMHTRTRQYLERAVNRGATVEVGASDAALMHFYELFLRTANRKRFAVRSFAHLQSLSRQYLSRGDGCLVLVRHGQSYLSGNLVAKLGRTAYLLHVGNDDPTPLARKLKPSYASHWQVLQWAKANGCDFADWGGSMTGFPPSPEDPGYSVYQFKAGFGCSIEYLTGYYDLIFRPGLYQTTQIAEKRLLPLAHLVRAKMNGWFAQSQPSVSEG